MKQIELKEEMFEGTISLLKDKDWLQPLRLRAEEIPLHHENFVERALAPGGSRIRFATNSASVTLRVEPEATEEARRFDLTTDQQLIATLDLPPKAGELRFTGWPAGRQVFELWLPTHRQVRIHGLFIETNAELRPAPDHRPRWITYGSSITHCKDAHSPSRTWPAVAARLAGLNLTNLGYGGNCHMEPLVAMMIRDRPADFISLKVGINMYSGSISERTYRSLLIGMVRIIREKQPATPIAVISPIISPPREETPGATGMNLRLMREELKTAVERLRACGDHNLDYFSGLDLFGRELVADYLPDLVHPNGDGYEIMGRNFVAKVIAGTSRFQVNSRRLT